MLFTVIKIVIKLANRMRSMGTNGASKNRDSCCYLFCRASKLLSIRIMFGTYGMCTYGMYTYGMHTFDLVQF